jgi:putative ABC transport system permease protein
MAILRLVLRMALRNRGRTSITALGVGVTLLAYLLLTTLIENWSATNRDLAHSDQLVVRHKVSIAFGLYKRMGEKIRAIPGVEAVSPLIWFSGYYKDARNRFGQLAVEAEPYFATYPEYAPPDEQMKAYQEDISGAIVGAELAERFGWKLGDKVTLIGTIYSGNWDLTVRGIYVPKKGYSPDWLFMHYKRLNAEDEHAHRLVVKAPPEAALEIDRLFANSETPTKTESELVVRRSLASWSAGVVAAIRIGSFVVLIILVLVLGNSMAMAARESTREYATMRAIGYRSRHIMALVLGEGCAVAAIGIALGLVGMPSLLRSFSGLMENRLGGSWQLDLDPRPTAVAAAVALAASMLASVWPAWRSGRLPIVDALRKST